MLALLLGVSPIARSNEPTPPLDGEQSSLNSAVRSHYEAGLAHAHRGDYEQAIAEFDQAIRLAPDFSQAFQDRGSSYAALQNPVAAMADYNRAIRLTPHDSNAYYNRGNLHLQQERYFQAIADYNRAVILNPGDAAAWQNRALGYAITGDLEKAVDGFQQAARLFQLQGNQDGYDQVLAILEYFQPDLDPDTLAIPDPETPPADPTVPSQSTPPPSSSPAQP